MGLVAGFPPLRIEFGLISGLMGFLVGEESLGQIIFKYFGLLYKLSFCHLFHIHNQPITDSV
jgi:hypothetical protein